MPASAATSLRVPESLTPDAVTGLSRQAREVLRGGGDVRLDCSALARLDSLGLAFLTALHREAEGKGRKLVLIGLPEGPISTFRVCPLPVIRPLSRFEPTGQKSRELRRTGRLLFPTD
jgi:ABC-type transporter Mla MlaB component